MGDAVIRDRRIPLGDEVVERLLEIASGIDGTDRLNERQKMAAAINRLLNMEGEYIPIASNTAERIDMLVNLGECSDRSDAVNRSVAKYYDDSRRALLEKIEKL